MTPATGPDLNRHRAAAALTPCARQVHLAVLTAPALSGRAPRRSDLERTARADGGDLAELAGRDVLAFDSGGGTRAACPFSPSPPRSG
jgi:hypothetical protein